MCSMEWRSTVDPGLALRPRRCGAFSSASRQPACAHAERRHGVLARLHQPPGPRSSAPLSFDFVKQTRDDARPRARPTARTRTGLVIVYPDNFPTVGEIVGVDDV